MSFFGAASTSTNVSNTTDKDVEVVDPPPDSISSLSFSPLADYLAVGSWDNNVRIYEVGANGQTQGKAMYGHQGPVLSVCWNKVREGCSLMRRTLTLTAATFRVCLGRKQNHIRWMR